MPCDAIHKSFVLFQAHHGSATILVGKTPFKANVAANLKTCQSKMILAREPLWIASTFVSDP